MKIIRSFTLYKIINNSIKNIAKPQNKIMLGRWGYNSKDIKSHYANLDHCGDYICGNPNLYKNIKK